MFPKFWKASLCVLALSLAGAAQTVTDSNGQPALLDQDSGIRVTLITDFDGSQALRFTGVNSCSQQQTDVPRSKLVPDPARKSSPTWQCGQRGVLTVKATSVQFASDYGTTRLDTASLSTADDNGVYVISTGSSAGPAKKRSRISFGGPVADTRDSSSTIALQTGMASEWVTGLIGQSLHVFLAPSRASANSPR